MNKKNIYLIIVISLILAITVGYLIFYNPYPKEIAVKYQGNIPEGTFKAVIGDEEIFTNGPDIISVILHEKSGVMKDFCSYYETFNKYFCPFRLGIKISDSSAEKQAQITSNLEVIKENDIEYLSNNLTLYLNGEKLDELRISAELKGVVNKDLQISGSGEGKSKKDAINDAKKRHNELTNIFLDIK